MIVLSRGFPGVWIRYRHRSALTASADALVGTVARWRHRRAAMRQLRALDDHVLKDIGLDRTEIMSVVAGDPAGRRRRPAGE